MWTQTHTVQKVICSALAAGKGVAAWRVQEGLGVFSGEGSRCQLFLLCAQASLPRAPARG